MTDKQILREKLSYEQHAMLFGILSKNLILTYGEEAKDIITQCVKKYGNQRGKRMALRVEKDGRDKNIINYMCYGEWKPEEEDMDTKIKTISPDLIIHVYKCPWCTIWKENNMLEYAYLYCKDIDEALVKGYNEQLTLNVPKNRAEGAEYCDFCFKNANLNNSDFEELAKIKSAINDHAIMGWDYHLGHIYKVMKENIIKKYGEVGDKLVKQSLEDFGDIYDKGIIDIIKEYEEIDFDKLP